MKNHILYSTIIAFLFLSCENKTQSDHEQNNSEVSKTPLPVGDANIKITNSYDANQMPDGAFESFYEDGTLKAEGMVHGGKRVGLWVAYHPNGNKQSENNYIDGVLDGKSFVMYPNGQMMYIGYFTNGKYDGQWLYFDKDGTTIKEVIYKGGEIMKTTEGKDILQ